MEFHPRINVHSPQVENSRIILGSFPTWSLADSLNEVISAQKKIEKEKNGDIPFFYGSSTNKFWHWYQTYVDDQLSVKNVFEIEKSLSRQSISITDVIISCLRKDKSALDKHLSKRSYNHLFFKYPKKGQKVKILCTSKGVMNEMLLNKEFYEKHPNLLLLEKESIEFQNRILLNTKGDPSLIKQPFYRALKCDNGGTIECFSIPSPGSPYRRLVDFGLNSGNLQEYLHTYLCNVFEWFKS